jgi:NAD(P)-dependent dehydrogenase (short-subunit alcohol dehydrogenase family)
MSQAAHSPFEGKTIVVSGASSGLGRAISVHLARKGANLVLIGRNRARLEETAGSVATGRCRVLELDLTRYDDIVPAIGEMCASAGRIYGLCHAAGTVETLQFSATTPARQESMMSVNYLGGMELARAICRRDAMDPGGGSVLFVSSIYSVFGKPGQIAYSGSKGAVVAAARAMAVELARRNIRVNVISPGMVQTEMVEKSFAGLSTGQVDALRATHPLGFGSPEEVAHAAAFLLLPESRWITGINLIVDGGCSAGR